MNTINKINDNLYEFLNEAKFKISSRWLKKVRQSKLILSSTSLSEKELMKITGFYLKNLSKKQTVTRTSKQYYEIIKKRIESGYSFDEIFEELSIFKKVLIDYIAKSSDFGNEGFKYFEEIYNRFDKEMFLILNQFVKIKFSQMTEESNRDFLTGVYNRKSCFERLTQELNRSKRYKRKIALLLLDLDKFKKINDKYGHPMGDRFLKLFGLFLTSHKRGSDFTARLGGDEFAIILPETDAGEAFWMAERLKEDFNEKLANKFEEVTVGLSIGIATNEKLSAFELYKLADKNLLKAKSSDRDRVIITKPKKAA